MALAISVFIVTSIGIATEIFPRLIVALPGGVVRANPVARRLHSRPASSLAACSVLASHFNPSHSC